MHRKRTTPARYGLTIIEIVVSVAIIIMLGGVVFGALTSFNRAHALDGASQSVLALLTEARTLTLSSREEEVYGVHFESDSATLFRGSSYSVSDPGNEMVELPSSVELSNIALSGGGSDVIFDRLTGKTAETGTLTLSLVSDITQTRTVRIDPSGIAEQQ